MAAATGDQSAQITVGPGGPLYIRVRNSGGIAVPVGVYVHKPGAPLLTSACAKATLLDTSQEYWVEAMHTGDALPARVVDVLPSPVKGAEVDIAVFQMSKAPTSLPSTVSDQITIWLRAFIPSAIASNPGYVRSVPGHPGQTMIPGPAVDATKRLPTGAAGDCFLTDGRGFSSQASSASKVETEFQVLIDQGRVSIQPSDAGLVHKAGVSTRVSCTTGTTVGDPKPGTFGVRALGVPAVADGKIQIAGQVGIKNPHLPAPWIDYSFDFIYDTQANVLTYSVVAGRFPAFEVYAVRGKNGPPITILQVEPQSTSAWGLIDGGLGLSTDRYTGTKQL
ncbi:hypothetical protein [Polyangium mundeleinium]|uniref:Uncharacterized protein n=1 Tax=Polyangium mundeleinium TaxID=2995306 RepID=A0ABT5EMY8_9BACT|nr:hypothetical protein [Polyangium mundeleinium]MDC0743195.1 hypothetical protein [Polyangium mundeleinium]